MEDFELKFAKELPEENNSYSIIFNDKKYNGWYLYNLEDEEYTETIVRFRVPKILHLYSDVARNFTDEERIVGMHRMLIGKDLKEEMQELLKHTDINEYVNTLEDDQVRELLDRMKSIVTFNCNQIPYMHIKQKKNEVKDYSDKIKEFIEAKSNFLKIFYEVLNEKITMHQAYLQSEGVIFSEYLQLK